MKRYTYLFIVLFFALIAYASTDFIHGIVGLTKLNGDGCVCHSLDPEPSVSVSVVGPSQLIPNQVANYTIRVTGGPAVYAGFNVASRFGTVNPIDTSVRKIDTEITHNNPKLFVNDSVKWTFSYKAPAQPGNDTIYSASLSANADGMPSFADKWNFGNNFSVTILNDVPVEFTSFTSTIEENKIILEWRTATEKNNFGFEVQRKRKDDENWNAIGFVKGSGTSTQRRDYSFADDANGLIQYRLKQVDLNGEFSFSKIIEVENIFVKDFSLEQNFPNPFNPSTKIRFINPMSGRINFSVFDLKGELVGVIAEKLFNPGNHEVEWNAGNFASGVYLIQATHSELNLKQTIKVILSK